MSELNEATKALLAQGYTRDQTPPGMCRWNDFDGGWRYTWESHCKQVYETPCGLLVKGSHFHSGVMWFGGREWSTENNCPTVTCPYGQKLNCELRHELLQPEHYDSGTLGLIFTCNCHQTERPYTYDDSWDRIVDEEQAEEDRRWEEFAAAHHWHVCRAHSHYNRNTRKWDFRYEPFYNCRSQCLGCPGCSVLGITKFSGKKANVYYDLKVTQIVKGCGLIPDEKRITITKGIKALEKQLPEEVCQAIAKVGRPEIQWLVDMNHHSDTFFTGTKYEVINLRAERRDVRDLDQDLADIAAGIEVVHKSDVEAKAKQAKTEKRKLAENKRRDAVKKRIQKDGFDALSEIEKIRAVKKFGEAEIMRIEETEKSKALQQITFFEEAEP